MQISFVVHVSCFLCLGREPRSAHHRFPSIRDPRSQIKRSTSRSFNFILKGHFLIEPFPTSILYSEMEECSIIKVEIMEESHEKNDLKSLLQWKTTENCTNMNVSSFYSVKAKSLESLKLAHIVRVQQMPKPRKQKVLGPKKPRPIEK